MHIPAFYKDIFIFFVMHRFKSDTLFELWHNEANKDSKILAILDHVANILIEEDLDSSSEEKLTEKICIFCSNVSIKWQNAHRNFNNFKSKHSNWLQVETVFDHLDTDADIVLQPESSTSGRPRISYEEKSLQLKRREATHLSKETQQHDPKLIVHAASNRACCKRFCRPLKLKYTKETKEHVLKETNEIDQQIEKLSDFDLELPNDRVLKINYNLYMTLIDGKILKILTDTKSSLSYLRSYPSKIY